jgi:hypothetical protein
MDQFAKSYFRGTWSPRRQSFRVSQNDEQAAFIERIETAKDNLQNLLLNIPLLPSFAPSKHHLAQSKLKSTLCGLREKLIYFFSVPPSAPLPPVETREQLEDATRMLLHVRLLRQEKLQYETAKDVLRVLERLLKHRLWWKWTELVDNRAWSEWKRSVDSAMFETMAVDERIKAVISVKEYEQIEHTHGTKHAEAWALHEARGKRRVANVGTGALMLPGAGSAMF